MTVEQLATESGLSTRGLMYLEHGQRNPRYLTLLNIAEALKVHITTLIGSTPLSDDA